MEDLIVRCIALLFDWVPYMVGRSAIFLLSFGSIQCERWWPITGQTKLLSKRWFDRFEGELVITHYGTRWIGAILLLAMILLAVIGTFEFITNL